MSKIIVGIGLSGSGKTTLLEKLEESLGYEYVSIDNIREELNVDPNITSPEKVWDVFRAKISHLISSGKDILVESTFVDGPDRRIFLNFLREQKVENVTGIFLDISPEIARERCKHRGRSVPNELFDKRVSQLHAELPNVNNGFDYLITFKITEHKLQGKLDEKTSSSTAAVHNIYNLALQHLQS